MIIMVEEIANGTDLEATSESNRQLMALLLLSTLSRKSLVCLTQLLVS
jgi:hypothetical protein